MNKNYFLILLFSALNYYCFGQEVAAEQKMLVTKITATWCPNCGTSAWDVKDDIVDNYSDNAIFLATHISSSSDLYSATAQEYAANLPSVIGQPLFYLNREKYNTSTIERAVQEMDGQIDGAMPLANTGIAMQLDGQSLEVRAKVQFFEATEGSYYLSLFIVEDNVIAFQSNRSSNADHRKVLRGRVTSETFGELIVDGSVATDETFDFSLSRAISSDWNPDNLEVVAVIWRRNGDTYEFINAESVTEFSVFTSLNPLEKEGVSVAVQPTTLNNQSFVTIELPTNQDNLSLQLVNSNGQLIKRLFDGSLNNGTHSFSIDKGMELPSGMYFVQLEQNGHSITRKIVVK